METNHQIVFDIGSTGPRIVAFVDNHLIMFESTVLLKMAIDRHNKYLDNTTLEMLIVELKHLVAQVENEINEPIAWNTIRGIATAWARETINIDDVIAKIDAHTGINIKTITQYDEGQIAYNAYKYKYTNINFAVFDSGGGSTQIVCANAVHCVGLISLGFYRDFLHMFGINIDQSINPIANHCTIDQIVEFGRKQVDIYLEDIVLPDNTMVFGQGFLKYMLRYLNLIDGGSRAGFYARDELLVCANALINCDDDAIIRILCLKNGDYSARFRVINMCLLFVMMVKLNINRIYVDDEINSAFGLLSYIF